MVSRKEVADRAGVSEAVVSYVMNNRKLVKEETRRKVLEAVRELGYRPNPTARSLKTKRTRQIAVLVHFLGNPFEAGVLLHMESRAKAHGYTLFFHTYRKDGDDVLEDLLAGRADGLLLLGHSLGAESAAYLRDAGLPVLSVMRPAARDENEFPYIDIDWTDGYRRLIRHLREAGHERIGYMTNGHPDSPIGYRLSCFREAARLEALELREEDVLDGGGRLESASRRLTEALRGGIRFEAVVGGNDLMAAGCLDACRRAGVSVPGGLAVAGSEDILMSSQTAPPLTSLRYPRDEAGALAVDLLQSMIEGEARGSRLHPSMAVLEAELVVREST